MLYLRILFRALASAIAESRLTLFLILSAGLVFPFSVAAQAQSSPPSPPPTAPVETRSDDRKLPAEPEQATSTTDSSAQTKNTKSRTEQCEISALGRCFKDFLHDQAGIWASPTRMRAYDLLWILPLAGGTGAAIATDSRALHGLQGHSDLARRSRRFSDTGSPYATVGAPILLYAIGSWGHHDRLRETGVLGIEAIADTAVVVEVLKLATNRERPDTGSGHGDFWPTGTRNYPAGFSMPSMHAAGSWALARVIAGEYPDKPLLKWALYGWATAVSVTRVTGRKHFPSDVLVGGAAGYLIGGYVLRHHSSATRDVSAFTILPFSDGATRSYGLTVAVKPEALQPQAIAKSFRNLTSFVREPRN